MVASSKVIKVGPCGGRGGSPWDNGPHRGVRTPEHHRHVRPLPGVDEGVEEYVDSNGRSVHGEKHGGATERSHSVKVLS